MRADDIYNPLPKWIMVWLLLSASIVLWDITFVFLRPASLPGGYLAFLWLPYGQYIEIDKSYADLNNAFVVAQAMMSLLEIMIGFGALYLNYLRKFIAAGLMAYSALLLTANKTILIFVLEWVSHFRNTGHNSLPDLILLYFLPNIIWVLVPGIALFVIARRLTINTK